jgi:hypothetical protein
MTINLLMSLSFIVAMIGMGDIVNIIAPISIRFAYLAEIGEIEYAYPNEFILQKIFHQIFVES